MTEKKGKKTCKIWFIEPSTDIAAGCKLVNVFLKIVFRSTFDLENLIFSTIEG